MLWSLDQFGFVVGVLQLDDLVGELGGFARVAATIQALVWGAADEDRGVNVDTALVEPAGDLSFDLAEMGLVGGERE